MYQRVKIEEEYAFPPEGDGGGHKCHWDQGIGGEDVVKLCPGQMTMEDI